MAENAFGKWLQANRKALGFSQTELADFLKTYQVKISQWETGKDRPGTDVVRELEELFEKRAPAAEGSAAEGPSAIPPTLDELRAMKAKPKKSKKKGVETTDYRHDSQTRTNIPTAKIAAEGAVPEVPKARYAYNPHLPPVLRFDPTGEADRVQDLITDAGTRTLTTAEQSEIREAVSHYDPWLEWADKREQHDRGFFEVDPVALHIHERVSAQAIVRTAMRKDVQRDLFADPEQPYHEAIQFYRHDVDWANRLILGDSLHVMSSLARREGLSRKVQAIYMDPPYGIKFASNFQPVVGRRAVKDKDTNLTREPESVRAYRDTWFLGIHSYLTYLRERLEVARDLLADTGSVFLQISDENIHVVRSLFDEIFGRENFCGLIAYKTTSGLRSDFLATSKDWIIWYCRDKSQAKFRRLFVVKKRGEAGATQFKLLQAPNGEVVNAGPIPAEESKKLLAQGWMFSAHDNLTSTGFATTTAYDVAFNDSSYRLSSPSMRWKTTREGMKRLIGANRVMVIGNTLRYKRHLPDFPVYPLVDVWTDTGISGFADKKRFVVQTNTKVVERCLLMVTDPGDVILDPTCGSGTTAYLAERWGRRWITIDTSRVAVAIARQRLLTAKYDHYRTQDSGEGARDNPGTGFRHKTVPHITLRSIAQNANLDPIFEGHDSVLNANLVSCNTALDEVTDAARTLLAAKLHNKMKAKGKNAVTDGDLRRWELPNAGDQWEHWEVPFGTDPDWPAALQEAVIAYRQAWRAMMDEVNACIATNAPQEELVDQPEVVKGVLRVSGPFTVEGVRPEELNLGEEGLFDGTPNTFEEDEVELAEAAQADSKNQSAYLLRMTQLLRADGVTFPNNQHRDFARIEPLFESSDSGGSLIHAEGLWQGEDDAEPNNVAIGFGPQYGPVTALQVEELVRSSRRYDELVIAGFSFDAAASAVIQESSHPKLRIHQAYIRPDVNPAMDGLLKDTPNSQLFTVFGQPEIEVEPQGSDWVCKLLGVDIYDPLTSEVRSTGASKVAAWFLDQDYDGRCFCITQAFFPDQKAWAKIAKALGSSADPEAFAAFEGTVSLPFPTGKHCRIAVKVIDPRGNEVMAIKSLET